MENTTWRDNSPRDCLDEVASGVSTVLSVSLAALHCCPRDGSDHHGNHPNHKLLVSDVYGNRAARELCWGCRATGHSVELV